MICFVLSTKKWYVYKRGENGRDFKNIWKNWWLNIESRWFIVSTMISRYLVNDFFIRFLPSLFCWLTFRTSRKIQWEFWTYCWCFKIFEKIFKIIGTFCCSCYFFEIFLKYWIYSCWKRRSGSRRRWIWIFGCWRSITVMKIIKIIRTTSCTKRIFRVNERCFRIIWVNSFWFFTGCCGCCGCWEIIKSCCRWGICLRCLCRMLLKAVVEYIIKIIFGCWYWSSCCCRCPNWSFIIIENSINAV